MLSLIIAYTPGLIHQADRKGVAIASKYFGTERWCMTVALEETLLRQSLIW